MFSFYMPQDEAPAIYCDEVMERLFRILDCFSRQRRKAVLRER